MYWTNHSSCKPGIACSILSFSSLLEESLSCGGVCWLEIIHKHTYYGQTYGVVLKETQTLRAPHQMIAFKKENNKSLKIQNGVLRTYMYCYQSYQLN